jgi:hypothetical protein
MNEDWQSVMSSILDRTSYNLSHPPMFSSSMSSSNISASFARHAPRPTSRTSVSYDDGTTLYDDHREQAYAQEVSNTQILTKDRWTST